MLENNVLFVVILRADLTISGLAYRLMATWRNLYEQEGEKKVYLITTRSLWKKMYMDEIPDQKYVEIIDDSQKYKLKMLLLSIIVLKSIILKKIKILHTNGNIFLLPLHYLKNAIGIKTVVTFGSASLEMGTGNNKRALRDWKLVLNAASAIDVLNPVNTVDGFKSQKFVSVCSFPYNYNKLIKDIYQNSIKKKMVTFVGSFTPQKNPLLAIEGFKIYLEKSKCDQIVLCMFGKGPLKNQLLKISDEINLNEKRKAIIIYENDELLYKKLSESIVFLSLQDHTNYPSQSLMEAMLLGNTIIATDFGDTDIMVLPEYNNVLISDKDPFKIAHGLRNIISLNSRFNIENSALIREKHNVKRFVNYLKVLYQKIST